MLRPRRQLALAAALWATAFAGAAAAQTLIIRNGVPATAVEVTLNGTPIGSSHSDNIGDARIQTHAFTSGKSRETGVEVNIDDCSALMRVVLVERNLPAPPAAAGCRRRNIEGTFVLRPTTSFVIDLKDVTPTLLQHQGPPPAEWLRLGTAPLTSIAGTTPGLVLWGGTTLTRFNTSFADLCGDAQLCEGKDFKPTVAFGGAYWFIPELGVSASFAKSAETTAAASQDAYTFDATRDFRIVTLMGNVAFAHGNFRMYGQLGTNYSQAMTSTTQTLPDISVVKGDVVTTFKGGTDTLRLRSGGWSWAAGGGVEVWWKPPVGFYGEVTRARLKGHDLDGGSDSVADGIIAFSGGVKFRVGRLGILGY
jgi:hypothetical protein